MSAFGRNATDAVTGRDVPEAEVDVARQRPLELAIADTA
jgi:hypothetical protein